MADELRYRDWVERYRAAWESNAPEFIEALFTTNALYYTEPFATPWRGSKDIVEQWLESKDEPGETEFEYEILTASPEIGFVKGRTYYRSSGTEYRNLWEIRLDGDRCREFVEWWMETKTKS